MKSDWKIVTINDCADVVGDGLHGTPQYSQNGEYAFVNGNNLINGKVVIKSDTKRVIFSEFEKYKKELNDRTIFVSINGTLGNVSVYNNEKIILGKSVCFINVKNGYDKNFLFYILSSPTFRNYMETNSTGTTIKNFSLKQMREYSFSLPDICLQKKIAAILSALDEKIAINRAINDNLLEQMQAIYKSWFVDYLPFGGVMPESWTKTGIYSLANIIYGAPFASKQFNTEGNGKPIIRIRDLKDQQFATYTTEVHPKGYLLRPGDIVVGMDGEFRPYIWGNDEAWLNQRVCVFENKRPKGKAFLYFTIKPLLYEIEQTQVATTVIHIGKKDYDAFEIMLPDAATLDSFDSLTAPMIMRVVSNSFENKRLAVMRDALLPRLMSGEIDVSKIDL